MIERLNVEMDLKISKTSLEPLREHLYFIDTIESSLKISDYIVSKYLNREAKNKRLCRQFSGISSHIDFLKKMYEKRNQDRLDGENWDLRTILDQENLESPTGVSTYVHFNWAEDFDDVKIVDHLGKLKKYKQIIIITLDTTGSKVVNGVSFNFISIKNHNRDLEKFSKKTFFDINLTSNDFYLTNKILVARNVLFDLIKERGYKGDPSYIYSDLENTTFGHFNLDLQSRIDLTMDAKHLPINERNYFDIYNIYKTLPDGTEIPVYIHFLTQHLTPDNLTAYIPNLAEEIREHIYNKESKPDIHLILILNTKKSGTKNISEQFAQKDSVNNLIIDTMFLDNVQYNPLKNVYQPKFRLIKRKTPEWNKVLQHYGSSDVMPRMLYKDPVNKFFGGERDDIYEIIRPHFIKINNDRNHQLNIDVPHRIVK